MYCQPRHSIITMQDVGYQTTISRLFIIIPSGYRTATQNASALPMSGDHDSSCRQLPQDTFALPICGAASAVDRFPRFQDPSPVALGY